ncbi:coproporphyrinogen dehydrogenase HemZ [Peptostreptococcus faecalis]|uniref:coproporphyrinogen dehydrogenase HemZ n=1 Tax=Peptostreptococcus faecalis TaxID=2045015 RepID=UPI000C7BFD15|nr:coproporphyrinogen dehydrogenase HemZ [Peptostreptococcus faecalis]
MKVILSGHNYRYEISEFLRLFSSEFSIVESSEDFDVIDDEKILKNSLIVEKNVKEAKISTTTRVYENGVKVYEKKIEDSVSFEGIIDKNFADNFADNKNNKNSSSKRIILTDEKKFAKSNKKTDNIIKAISKRIIQRSMFEYMVSQYDVNIPWGILTGIRPVKIINSLLDSGKSIDEIRKFMKEEYLINDEKLDLIIEIANRERVFIYPVSEKKISLYISIPFCPSRCVYCSFPSHILEKFGDLRGEYVQALLKEAKGVSKLLEKQDKKIESLYIGGGTPTSLEAGDMDYLIRELFKIFDLNDVKEFTVEAGRPDTITIEKLKVLKKHNVSRISINPQTMNQITLDKIGRKHSVEDIKDCFYMARNLGFHNINMDLILGLPGETVDMVENTIKEIVKLDPECVTVHTLAMKRTSELSLNKKEYEHDFITYKEMVEMINISKRHLTENSYNPYYLYRQKYMMGNLENIGYSKDGYECIYNMQVMEENQSNYAIGAGAVSKFVYLDENRIERVDDVKNLEQYLSRVDEMIEKKCREVEKNDNKRSKRD